MGFRYTKASPSQHLTTAVLLGLAIAIGATSFGAAAWAGLVDRFSDRVLMTGGLMVLHTLVFWPVCLAFHYVDTHDRPAFIARHRIQTTKRRHPDLATTLRVLLRNQFLWLPALLLLFTEVMLWRGWTAERELPSLPRLALELAGLGICAVVIFYVSHRLLHRTWWMKKVHVVHHEFRTTTAFASEYAHPFEFAVGNLLTMVGGALLLAPHLASMYLFALLGLTTILIHHSGYALPWASWSVPHDWHHYRMSELFGTLGHLDRFFRTDEVFRTLEDGDER